MARPRIIPLNLLPMFARIPNRLALAILSLALALTPCLSGLDKLDNRDFGEHDNPRLVRAIERHDLGVEGSESAVDQAIEILEALLKDSPENALARAYLGSAYTIKARDVALWSKRRWAERGAEALDAAVKAAPLNPRVRLVRAINSYNLPRILGRHGEAKEDFAFLLQAVESHPESLGDDLKRAIYFHAGAFALRESENERALTLLEKANAFEGDSPISSQIDSMLRIARERNS